MISNSLKILYLLAYALILKSSSFSNFNSKFKDIAFKSSKISLEKAFEIGINDALARDYNMLNQVLGEDCSWDTPIGKYTNIEDINREISDIGSFLRDSKFSVIGIKKLQNGSEDNFLIEWIASGTWPLPWSPRLIIEGKTEMKQDKGKEKIVTMKDSWENGIFWGILRHLLPGFWDIWGQFCSPQAERYPFKVLNKRNAYQIWETTPKLAVKATKIDRTNSRKTRMAYIIPNFCFTANITTSGRKPEEYFTTSPIEAQISPIIETSNVTDPETGSSELVRTRANKITWSLQVPTFSGIDENDMPPLKGKNYNETDGDFITYVKQPRRIIAVSDYNGSVQDKEAGNLRSNILNQLEKDGLKVKLSSDERPITGFMSFDAKVCWNKKGNIGMAIYEYRPKFIGKGNKIFVELEETNDKY